ncbi:hypothetical protein NKG05_27075 [Oerskovia sp. M15]
MVRAFHEQYGTDALVISSVATRPMADSSFVTNIVTPGIDDPEVLVAALERVAAQHPGGRSCCSPTRTGSSGRSSRTVTGSRTST